MSITDEINKTLGIFVSENSLSDTQFKLYIVHGDTEYNKVYGIGTSAYCMECYLAEGIGSNKVAINIVYKKMVIADDNWRQVDNIVSITAQDMMTDLSHMKKAFVSNLDVT